MAIKLEIPTALRAFTGKQDSVEVEAATVGEALRQLTHLRRLQKHLYTDDGAAAQLREYLRERRGHPLPGEGKHAHQGRRHDQHRPVHRRRRGRPADAAYVRRKFMAMSNQHAAG